MSTPLRVLITTDSFPPVCGGSGWSTWELVRGLAARGHHVEVVKVEIGSPVGVFESRYSGFRVSIFRSRAPDVPVVRNVVKNERLWSKLTRYLLESRVGTGEVDILHAQHVLTTVPSVRAGILASVPVVATVRDYWPVCYWSDLILDSASTALCPGCSVGRMRECVASRAGGSAAAMAAWSVIPYMRRNLRTKRSTLAQSGAVIAVSSVIADDLRARARELAETPVFTIPNAFDFHEIDAAYNTSSRPLDVPYAIYAGKLAPNKGVQFLARAFAEAEAGLPLVVLGDGPLRGELEAEGARLGLDLRVLGWQDRPVVLQWMRHATLLAFPSLGPESLSRVLVEAAALGVPIAAMDTGGTRDIIQHGRTGLLSTDVAGFTRDLARLAGDDRLRAALGAAARRSAREKFSSASVVERVEQVYRGLLRPRAA